MAVIYSSVNSLVDNPGEKKVLALLEKMGDEYTVFHGVHWRFPKKIGGFRDAETDFLIIHPSKGFLVLEVKGIHRIKIEGRRWKAPTYEMIDPYEKQQANLNMLMIFLRGKIPEMQGEYYCSCFGVCFTEIEENQYSLGPMANEFNTIYKDNLNNFEEKINFLYEHSSKNIRYDSLSRALIGRIKDFIAPTTELKKSLSSVFDDTDHNLILLNDKQKEIIAGTSNSPVPVIVYGPAGSGKTQVAISQAIDELRFENQVIFITNSYHSVKFIAKEIAINNIDNNTIKENLLLLVAKDEKLISKIQNFIEQSKATNIKFIIDESQVISFKNFERILALTKESSQLSALIFRDESQTNKLQVKYFADSYPYHLPRIVRNTRNIYNEFEKYIDKSYKIIPPENDGDYKPRFINVKNKKGLIEELIRDIEKFISAGSRGNDITILFDQKLKPEDDLIVSLAKKLDIQGYSLSIVDYSRPTHPNQITYSTIWDFQGLENNIVLLVELTQSLHETVLQKRSRYIGRSRAKNVLNIYLIHLEDNQIDYSKLF